MYTTEYPDLLAQVETFVQAAKQAGVNIPLNPQGETTMFSIGGTCPPGPCNWGMQIYDAWEWNYGEGALYPSGDSDFTTGNYWGGGYSSPTANRLIVFEIGDKFFHGHPDPLACPEGRSRRSMSRT